MLRNLYVEQLTVYLVFHNTQHMYPLLAYCLFFIHLVIQTLKQWGRYSRFDLTEISHVLSRVETMVSDYIVLIHWCSYTMSSKNRSVCSLLLLFILIIITQMCCASAGTCEPLLHFLFWLIRHPLYHPYSALTVWSCGSVYLWLVPFRLNHCVDTFDKCAHPVLTYHTLLYSQIYLPYLYKIGLLHITIPLPVKEVWN